MGKCDKVGGGAGRCNSSKTAGERGGCRTWDINKGEMPQSSGWRMGAHE